MVNAGCKDYKNNNEKIKEEMTNQVAKENKSHILLQQLQPSR